MEISKTNSAVDSMAKQTADIDDDIPQLEDMTRDLEKLMIHRSRKRQADPQGREQKAMSSRETGSSEDKQDDDGSDASFGGFRKGFLVSSAESRRQRKKASPSDIPVIQPQEESKTRLESEIQESTKISFPLLQSKEWITEDLLSKVRDNPVLSESFKDPTLSKALLQLQWDPQAVIASADNNPKIKKFLKEFSAIMGDHFNKLAEKKDKKSSGVTGEGPLISEAPESEEEARTKEIMLRLRVKEALSDPAIQKFIVALREDTMAAQGLLYHGSRDFKRKVQALIDNGLVTCDFYSFN